MLANFIKFSELCSYIVNNECILVENVYYNVLKNFAPVSPYFLEAAATPVMVYLLSSSCINTVVVLGFKVNPLSSDVRMRIKCSTRSTTLSLIMFTDIHALIKPG